MYITFSPIISGSMNRGAWQRKFTPKEMAALTHSFPGFGITAFNPADIYIGYSFITHKEEFFITQFRLKRYTS